MAQESGLKTAILFGPSHFSSFRCGLSLCKADIQMGNSLDLRNACGESPCVLEEEEWSRHITGLCGSVEDGDGPAISSGNTGNGLPVNSQSLLNHELLKCARAGDAPGISEALRQGAWVETRR